MRSEALPLRRRRGRQPRRVRHRGRRARAARRGARAARPRGSSWRSSSRARRACSPHDGEADRRGAAGAGRRRQRPRRGRRVRRRAVPRPSRWVGTRADRCGSATRPVPSSPGGWRAPTPCRPPPRSRRSCEEAVPCVRTTAAGPGRHPRAPARRDRRGRGDAPRAPASLLGEHGRLMMIAADHPARGALARRRAPAGHGRPRRPARPARAGAVPARASTACSAPRTSSRTCCCSARWTARSSSAR